MFIIKRNWIFSFQDCLRYEIINLDHMFQYHNFQSLNPSLITNTECIFLYSTKLKIETVETKLVTEYELLAGQL